MTETDIANGALTIIGSPLINSLDDDTKSARIIKNQFELCRRAVLRLHPWNFASARAILDPVVGTPLFDYEYAHELPSDYLRIIKVDDGDTAYRIEGRHILSNSTPLEIRYVKDLPTLADADPLFAETLSAYIAWKIAYALTQSSELRQLAMQEYQLKIRSAKFVNATEENPEELEASTYTDSRLAGPGFVRDPMT